MAKTIFHPGKAVTTKYLNSAQYLGPTNPGVVFKANPINDYEYPLLKAESINLNDFSNYFVSTTANQAVGGFKAFDTIPTVPTSVNTSGNQVANVQYVQDLAGGAVKTIGDQTITGLKTFQEIKVPTTPDTPASPVPLGWFYDNAVLKTGSQFIQGNKNFSGPVEIPYSAVGNNAVNNDRLNTRLSTIPVISVTQGCIQIGNLQIISGQSTFNGDLNAFGAVTFPLQTFRNFCPAMKDFTYIISVVGNATALMAVQMVLETDNKGFKVIGDNVNSVVQPNTFLFYWQAIGYVS
jgi:hypothetical protein